VLADNRELNPIRRTALQTLHLASGCEIFFDKRIQLMTHPHLRNFRK
jgi:hypothetical protein